MSRFRLYPTPTQEAALLTHCEHARFMWNLGHEQRGAYHPGWGPAPWYVEQCRQLTEARAAFPWLAAGSYTVQQQALRDLDQAWRNFFAGTHSRPKFRKGGRSEGFRIIGEQAARIWQDSRKWSSVLVPKIGWVRFRRSRALPQWKSYRITRDRSGRWHIALTAIPEPTPGPGTGEIVGVDRGVKVAVALSTGEMFSPGRLRPKEAERLLRLQRRFARARRGSNRRSETKHQIARARAREAGRRKDWVEKTTTDLARRFDQIHLEDLNVKGMTRSARGTADAPGRGVRQKAGLNRGILAAGWGMFIRRMEDKAPGRVVKVNPAYTSQTCNACGHVAPENRESQAVFRCVTCGHQDNADVNAARNIAAAPAAGRAVAARRDMGAIARSTKREPQLVAPQGRDSWNPRHEGGEDVNFPVR